MFLISFFATYLITVCVNTKFAKLSTEIIWHREQYFSRVLMSAYVKYLRTSAIPKFVNEIAAILMKQEPIHFGLSFGTRDQTKGLEYSRHINPPVYLQISGVRSARNSSGLPLLCRGPCTITLSPFVHGLSKNTFWLSCCFNGINALERKKRKRKEIKEEKQPRRWASSLWTSVSSFRT